MMLQIHSRRVLAGLLIASAMLHTGLMPGSGNLFAQQPVRSQAGAPQQNSAQQVASPQQVAPAQGNQQQAAQAMQPAGAAPLAEPFPPLDPQYQEYMDKVLTAWEQSTANIERFRCGFKRWEYDPANGPAQLHNTYSEGVLRYMKPDKGLFKVESLYFYKGQAADGQPKYEQIEGRQGEHWVCDGKAIHVYDHTQKVVNRYDLPPQMQGVKIYQSPLPFLFGVNGAEVKQRYWIRPIQPPTGSQNEVWLEAFPKVAADAANYLKVHVVLDATEVLPKALIVFLPNYTEQNPQRSIFEFHSREKNWTLADRLNALNLFQKEFIPLTPPSDYKVIVTPVQQENAPPGERVAQPNPPISQPAPRRQ